MSHRVVIAVDGPAASGKSSVSRELARRLGFSYVNSGALYRALTWLILRELSPEKQTDEEVACYLPSADIVMELVDRVAVVRVHGRVLEDELCGEEVNRNVSRLSALSALRAFVLERLRGFADHYNLVMEGRDIGSVVFPETPYKFYLDASPEVRRQRRASQGQEDSILQRDRIDSTRVAAPLTIADDALVIDSTHLTLDGVVGEIIGRLKLKGLEVPG
jgi:cytidylate kinase